VIELKEEHDHDGHSHGRILEEELYEADFDLDGSSDTSWDFQADGNVNIDIPSDVETGHYMFMVKVMDSDGNMTIFEEEIHIH